MTRFARGFRKRFLDATPWHQLKKQGEVPENQEDDRTTIKREARKRRREKQKVCFKCREKGHSVADCPQKSESEVDIVCYQCGSTEHTVKNCRSKKHPKGKYPHAQCFVCKGVGHISSQCPDNPKGLYPMGGGCKLCGSNEHFKRDCPEKKKKGPSKGTGKRRKLVSQSVDALDLSDPEVEIAESPLPKKKKVVRF